MQSHTGSGSFSIINGGTFNTPPIITLVGGGSPIIVNNSLSTQNRIRIKGAGGGTVVINCRDQTVTLNGASAPQIFDAEDSWFWALVAGVNNITVTGATATIQWADARI